MDVFASRVVVERARYLAARVFRSFSERGRIDVLAFAVPVIGGPDTRVQDASARCKRMVGREKSFDEKAQSDWSQGALVNAKAKRSKKRILPATLLGILRQ